MSFNLILIVAVMFLAVLIPIVGCFMFERGYKLGVSDYNTAHRDEPKAEIEGKKEVKVPKEDKKLKMYEQLLENIENYDGTTAGQKDIEVI